VPKELYPSSYECDCCHQSHFFWNTVLECKQKSQKKPVYLGDADAEEDTIVFEKGEMTEIPLSKIPARSSPQEPTMSKPGNAAVLSLIIPGLGQIYNGKFLRGIFWLIITREIWLPFPGSQRLLTSNHLQRPFCYACTAAFYADGGKL